MRWLVALVLGFVVVVVVVVVVVEFAVCWFFAVWVGFWVVRSAMRVRFVLVRPTERLCPWLRRVSERCFVDLVLTMS